MTLALITLGFVASLCAVGHLSIRFNPYMRRLHIPASIVGGFLGLLFFNIPGEWISDAQSWVEFRNTVSGSAREMPPLLINIVFASLMLGNPKLPFKKALRIAKPNIIMGHAFAWGQHWMGTLCALFILDSFYDQARFLAPLIAIGFQGGHGTAAGLKKTFHELGFGEGVDLGLGVATGGVLVGLLSGILLLQILQKFARDSVPRDASPDSSTAVTANQSSRDSEGHLPGDSGENLVSQLTIQSGFIGMTVAVGWVLLQVMQKGEMVFLSGPGRGLVRYIPLFPMVLIASMLVNALFRRTSLFHLLDRQSIERIGSMALDLLIVSAIATLNLAVLSRYGVAVTVLIGLGVAWNIGLFLVVGPLLYPSPWYVHALPDYGGATATTASGLLLADVADPEDRTRSKTSYTFKQPFYEPFMGGGFVTALSLPLIKKLGLWVYFGGLTVIMAVLSGLIYISRTDSLHHGEDETP